MDYVGYRARQSFSDGRVVPEGLFTGQTMPTQQVSFSRTPPGYPVLQFWTLSMFCRISDVDVFMATACLTDSNHKKCGVVWLDGFEETTFFQIQSQFEIILISEGSWGMGLPKFEIDSQAYQVADKWGYYHVMLLEWQGGIAERRGVGLLCQGAVNYSLDPGPVWKEIFLA